MPQLRIGGLHHVTAIASDPQKNVDFYAGLLGLRLVKRTVNFDDPYTYHFYFGDAFGNPGTLLTFFLWTSAVLRGRSGTGQAASVSFSVPPESLAFWTKRLERGGVSFDGPRKRFDEEIVSFRDPDGIEIELVGVDDPRPSWNNGVIPHRYAIRGLFHVTLRLEGYERTAGLLSETFGLRPAVESGTRFRYVVGDGGPGMTVDLVCQPNAVLGRAGVGTIHHVAWRTESDRSQTGFRQALSENGYDVTPVLDRSYFRSIYFREPGRVLFEIATDPPGFVVDEPMHELGLELKLPRWLEARRPAIEDALPAIEVPPSNNPDVMG